MGGVTTHCAGNAASNSFDGGPGADVIVGGAGSDTIDYSLRGPSLANGSPVTVSLDGVANDGASYGPYPGTGPEKDNVHADVETVRGTSEGDTLIAGPSGSVLDGRAGDDRLLGGAGADSLSGGAGNDTLRGGGAADELTGGDGTDTADYSERSSGLTVALDGSPDSGNAADGAPGATDMLATDLEDVVEVPATIPWPGMGSTTAWMAVSATTNCGASEAPTPPTTRHGRATSTSISPTAPIDGAADERDTVNQDVENVYAGAGDDVLIGSSQSNLLLAGPGD